MPAQYKCLWAVHFALKDYDYAFPQQYLLIYYVYMYMYMYMYMQRCGYGLDEEGDRVQNDQCAEVSLYTIEDCFMCYHPAFTLHVLHLPPSQTFLCFFKLADVCWGGEEREWMELQDSVRIYIW